MSDTFVTHPGVAELREEMISIARRMRAVEEQLRHYEGIDATINEHDDRLDELDRHRIATDAAVRTIGETVKNLVRGVTERDALSKRVLELQLATLRHMGVTVPPEPEFA